MYEVNAKRTVTELVPCAVVLMSRWLKNNPALRGQEERECRMASGQHPWDWRLCTAGPDRPREGIWSGNWDTLGSVVLRVQS